MVSISHFHTLPPTILPTLRKVLLRLSEHGDVIFETQTVCLATYLSFWLLSEQCLATSV